MSSPRRGRGGPPRGRRLYDGAVRVLASAMIAIGALALVVTLAAGGGPASLGTVLGLALIGVGVGRLWLATRMSR